MNRLTLLEMIRRHFSEDDLREISFELRDALQGREYDDLPGEGRFAKARELVALCERTGQLPALLAICERQRPQLDWYGPEMSPPSAGGRSSVAGSNDEQARTRAREERLYSELLAPMMIQLERTRQAFNRWRSRNLYLESEIIRKGNLAVRDLLIEKASLIPADLHSDAQRLVAHYDRWLEEYDRLRGGTEPDPSAPFVFVGPKGYPFPVTSEQRFMDRFELLREKLEE